jgi:arginine decarboxylase
LQRYGLDIWGDDNFKIEDSYIKLNYKSSPSLYDIVSKIREDGLKGPLLLRFPHLVKKQIDAIFSEFKRASKELNYKGSFSAVYPLKVNQNPILLKSILTASKEYNYGLEAGSKAELLIAMSNINDDAPITVNGFKDRELISLGFLSAKMGQNITLTIEGINELETIIEVAKEEKIIPNIGLRVRLHSLGVGLWAKSGGINSKFGLSATELITAVEMLKKNNLLEKFSMIHFHIGSQITSIAPLKKALKEVGNIYADLIKMGATNLNTINLGGGLAIEYAQNPKSKVANYSLSEYANDIVFMLQIIAKNKKVKEPNILIESGRFITASHAILIAPVYELFSHDYRESLLKLKEKNPPLVDELKELYDYIEPKNALEFLHDSLDHLNSLLTLFDLGYIDLQDRSNAEILTHLIIEKAILLIDEEKSKEIKKIENQIQEKYLVNFSLFQSMPDFWGLKQHFPVMPISKLDKKPTRSATIWDITCDSDGEISFDEQNPLYLHNVDIKKENYFLAFFLVGAYQEILGMKHNLFEKPTEVTIKIDENSYTIENLIEANSIYDTLNSLGYNMSLLEQKLKRQIKDMKDFEKLDDLLKDNSYLRTFINQDIL